MCYAAASGARTRAQQWCTRRPCPTTVPPRQQRQHETTLVRDTVLRHRGVRGKFRIVHVDANPELQPRH
ncbi:MAG TPA: hypothetical protein EYP33_00110 [Pyrodictium sp.]|nr:hypothetical protein [Pyrodictium sp.]